MKRYLFFTSVIIAACLCLITSCRDRSEETPFTAAQMAEAILITQLEMPALNKLTIEDADFSDQLANFYGIDADGLKDGAILYAGGGEATEAAVFVLSENAAPEKTEEALKAYISGRAAAFSGYAPREAAIAESGIVLIRGGYIALIICAETQKASDAFNACFDSPTDISLESKIIFKDPEAAEVETPPELYPGDDYDPGAILAAFRMGDSSSLSPGNLAILEACADVIDDLDEDYTDLEKEEAIHDWIVRHADYDEEAIELPPGSPPPDPDDETPYGILFKRKATCMGYTLTFQLFMDMLEIPCLTVEGTSGGGDTEHAWNMVELYGEWYHVDVTWDDPVGFVLPGTKVSREFFNVSEEYLRDRDHQWEDLD